MTDLREKIADVLDEWVKSVLDYSNYEGGIPNTICDIADRILALLPKMPELQWDEYNNLMLGDIDDGIIAGEVSIDVGDRWLGRASHEWIDQLFATREEARAAVEAAVRKALGWE